METSAISLGHWFPERQVLIRAGLALCRLLRSPRLPITIIGLAMALVSARGAVLQRAQLFHHAASARIAGLTKQAGTHRQDRGTAAVPAVGEKAKPARSEGGRAKTKHVFAAAKAPLRERVAALAHRSSRTGRSRLGGPYVATAASRPMHEISGRAPHVALGNLPLAAPLDHYALESGFGVRTDPINGDEAVHTGVDLSAPYRSPVHSTAAGAVVFAGYAAAYGKMVEIDHGNGIHTRYAHLNRITAKVGQQIGRHAVIGLLGSTGRSTGPHVHYEVLVNGVAQDPERFLNGGRAASVINAAD